MFASRITTVLLLLALVALPTQAACNRRASLHQHPSFAYDADVEAAVEQISDLRTHISQLRSELLESKAQTLDLKEKLAASQTTTTTPQTPTQTSVPVPAAPLAPGSRGAQVAQLQDALVGAGFMNPNHPYLRMGRGMYGPYTTSTVAAVQRNELKVEATGIYDDAVRTLLLSKLSTPPAAAAAPSATAAAAATATATASTPAHKPCCLCMFLPFAMFVLPMLFHLLASCAPLACVRRAPCLLMALPCLLAKAFFGMASLSVGGFFLYHAAGLSVSVLALVLSFLAELIVLLMPYTLLLAPLLLLATFSASCCGGAAAPRCAAFRRVFFSCQQPSPSVPEGEVLPAPALSPGARGPGVAQLQDILIQLGLMTPAMVRYGKGSYRRFTTEAVANIQRNLKLEASGIYDAHVRNHLLEQMGMTVPAAAPADTTTTTTTPVPAAPLAPGSRGAQVAQLQDALVGAGFMNPNHPYLRMGRGMYGPYTTSTVAAVQRNELKVEATGIYDDAVRTLLLSKLAPSPPTEASSNTKPSSRPAAAAAWRRMGISTCIRSCLAKKDAAASAEQPTEAPAVAPEQAPAVKEAVKEDLSEKKQPLKQQQQQEEEHVAAAWPLDEPLGSRLSTSATAIPQTQKVDVVTTRKTLLLELGFDAAEVESALEATRGSLENAAEWLFVNWKKDAKELQPAPEPEFPEQWLELVADLEEMGFKEGKAKSALLQSDGSLKEAVKVLVVLEREGAAKSA